MKKLIFLFFLISSPCYALTETTSTICSSGCDYTSVSAWNTARGGDLVSTDVLEIGDIQSDLTEDVTISGNTTDATRYMRLISSTGSTVTGYISLQSNYSQIIGVKIHGYLRCGTGSGGYCTIKKCTVYDSANTLIAGGNYHNMLIENTLVYNGHTNTYTNGFSSPASGTMIVRNSTCDNVRYRCYSGESSTLTVTNSIGTNCNISGTPITGCFGGLQGASDYNIDEGTSISNTNDITSADPDDIYIDASSANYHLSSAPNVAIDSGDDLSAYFDYDLDDVERPQSTDFDIGAYEFFEASTPERTKRIMVIQ